jgi:tight adherence protein B
MSGWVVGLLPVGVFGVISVLAPEIESVLTSNPFGRLMALAAVVLEAAGLLVIRSIVSIRY